MQSDLAVGLTPDEPDREPAAQLAAGGLAADPALEPRPERVQLGLGHRALESQQEAVVERAGVIKAIGVADHGVGHAAEVEQPVPVGVVARQPRGLEAENEPGVAERDLGHQVSETGALGVARARDTEVLVDHHDLLAGEAELDRAGH